MNNAPFNIGQKVVAIQTVYNAHGVGIIKDVEYTVKNLRQGKCCGYWMVDVGLRYNPGTNFCECGKQFKSTGNVWISHCFFAPIEENTYEDVTKELAVLPQDEVPDVKEIKELVN